MSLKTVAKYSQGVKFTRFFPYNDDLTVPWPTSVDPAGKNALIGGVGPFDFSGVDSDGAVQILSKIDDGSVETNYVDLSTGVADLTAVTPTELVARLTAATITGATFSVEAVTGRVKCVFASGSYWQLYGECARIAMFGQGFGMRLIKSDTIKSFNEAPDNKEDNKQTDEDANGNEVEVVTPGYRKGANITIVDVPEDDELLALIEGGVYDYATNGYSAPTSNSVKPVFGVEFFHPYYGEGSSNKPNMAGYRRIWFRNCQGTIGDKAHDIGISETNLTVTAKPYTDEAGVLWSDREKKLLTVEAYLLLDVANV